MTRSQESRGYPGSPTPLAPEEIEHIADIIAEKFPLCADQLREHARAIRAAEPMKKDVCQKCGRRLDDSMEGFDDVVSAPYVASNGELCIPCAAGLKE